MTPDAEPTFREPWEAQAFAIVVKLHEAGLFTWTEWAEALSGEIRAAQQAGDPDTGVTYYRHWLAALESLVRRKGLVSDSELRTRQLEVAANAGRHLHQARRTPLAIG